MQNPDLRVPRLGSRGMRRLSIAILVAGAVLGLFIWRHVAHRSSAVRAAREQLRSIADHTQLQLSARLRELLRDTDAVAVLPFPLEPDAPAEWVGAFLRRRGYVAVAVFGGDSSILYVEPADQAEALRSYLATQGPLPPASRAALLPMVELPGGGSRFLGTCVELLTPAGDPRGSSLVTLMDASEMVDPLMRIWPIPSATGESLLVRRDPDELVFLTNVRNRSDAALRLRMPVDAPDLVEGRAARGEVGPVTGVDYRDVPVFAELRSVPEAGWSLVVKKDMEEALAPAGVDLSTTILLCAGALLIAALALALAGSRVRLGAARRKAGARAWFRAMLDGSRDAIIIATRDLRVAWMNASALTLFGYPTLEEVRDRSILDFFSEEDRERLTKISRDRDEGRSAPGVYELTGVCSDGKTLRLELAASLVRFEGETYRQAVLRDVTDRHRTHAALEFEAKLNATLHRVQKAVAGAPQPEFVAGEALAGLIELSGARHGIVSRWDAERRCLRIQAQVGGILENPAAGDDPTEIPDPGGLLGWVLAKREAILVNDVSGDERSEGVPPGHQPIENFVGAPILRDQEVLGIIGVANAPRPFTKRDVVAAEHFALLYADSLRRAEEVERMEELAREREVLERQYETAQRLEAVGRLAGGVAHDFNNLLTVIGGYAELLIRSPEPAERTRSRAEEIRAAVTRAGTLTRQLLAFSRRQILDPIVLDLNELIRQMHRLLSRLIGEDLKLRTFPQPGLWSVRADPAQIEQILANLAVNARDAMAEGGALTIETSNVVLDERYVGQHPGARTGRHVMLSVSDTGVGMSEEVRARVFEPFFTTKAPSKGTGLGLATVHGIVNQSGGSIHIYSEEGCGTTFKIYLPAVDEEPEPLPLPSPTGSEVGGTETILLTEDDPGVRDFTAEVIAAAGYDLLVAANGREGLETARTHDGPIHMLVTDVVMPEMGGRQLMEAFAAVRPDAAVLFVSGYTQNAIHEGGFLLPGVQLLQKPFTPSELLRRIRELLDG